MVKTTEYFEFAKKEFPKLRLLTAAIVMKHGANHPELKEVRQIFSKVNKATRVAKRSGVVNEEISKSFQELQSITNNYKIPSDACEGYKTTYQLLEQANDALNA